jgi:hypothetical protein
MLLQHRAFPEIRFPTDICWHDYLYFFNLPDNKDSYDKQFKRSEELYAAAAVEAGRIAKMKRGNNAIWKKYCEFWKNPDTPEEYEKWIQKYGPFTSAVDAIVERDFGLRTDNAQWKEFRLAHNVINNDVEYEKWKCNARALLRVSSERITHAYESRDRKLSQFFEEWKDVLLTWSSEEISVDRYDAIIQLLGDVAETCEQGYHTSSRLEFQSFASVISLLGVEDPQLQNLQSTLAKNLIESLKLPPGPAKSLLTDLLTSRKIDACAVVCTSSHIYNFMHTCRSHAETSMDGNIELISAIFNTFMVASSHEQLKMLAYNSFTCPLADRISEAVSQAEALSDSKKTALVNGDAVAASLAAIKKSAKEKSKEDAAARKILNGALTELRDIIISDFSVALPANRPADIKEDCRNLLLLLKDHPPKNIDEATFTKVAALAWQLIVLAEEMEILLNSEEETDRPRGLLLLEKAGEFLHAILNAFPGIEYDECCSAMDQEMKLRRTKVLKLRHTFFTLLNDVKKLNSATSAHADNLYGALRDLKAQKEAIPPNSAENLKGFIDRILDEGAIAINRMEYANSILPVLEREKKRIQKSHKDAESMQIVENLMDAVHDINWHKFPFMRYWGIADNKYHDFIRANAVNTLRARSESENKSANSEIKSQKRTARISMPILHDREIERFSAEEDGKETPFVVVKYSAKAQVYHEVIESILPAISKLGISFKYDSELVAFEGGQVGFMLRKPEDCNSEVDDCANFEFFPRCGERSARDSFAPVAILQLLQYIFNTDVLHPFYCKERTLKVEFNSGALLANSMYDNPALMPNPTDFEGIASIHALLRDIVQGLKNLPKGRLETWHGSQGLIDGMLERIDAFEATYKKYGNGEETASTSSWPNGPFPKLSKAAQSERQAAQIVKNNSTLDGVDKQTQHMVHRMRLVRASEAFSNLTTGHDLESLKKNLEGSLEDFLNTLSNLLILTQDHKLAYYRSHILKFANDTIFEKIREFCPASNGATEEVYEELNQFLLQNLRGCETKKISKEEAASISKVVAEIVLAIRKRQAEDSAKGRAAQSSDALCTAEIEHLKGVKVRGLNITNYISRMPTPKDIEIFDAFSKVMRPGKVYKISEMRNFWREIKDAAATEYYLIDACKSGRFTVGQFKEIDEIFKDLNSEKLAQEKLIKEKTRQKESLLVAAMKPLLSDIAEGKLSSDALKGICRQLEILEGITDECEKIIALLDLVDANNGAVATRAFLRESALGSIWSLRSKSTNFYYLHSSCRENKIKETRAALSIYQELPSLCAALSDFSAENLFGEIDAIEKKIEVLRKIVPHYLEDVDASPVEKLLASRIEVAKYLRNFIIDKNGKELLMKCYVDETQKLMATGKDWSTVPKPTEELMNILIGWQRRNEVSQAEWQNLFKVLKNFYPLRPARKMASKEEAVKYAIEMQKNLSTLKKCIAGDGNSEQQRKDIAQLFETSLRNDLNDFLGKPAVDECLAVIFHLFALSKGNNVEDEKTFGNVFSAFSLQNSEEITEASLDAARDLFSSELLQESLNDAVKPEAKPRTDALSFVVGAVRKKQRQLVEKFVIAAANKIKDESAKARLVSYAKWLSLIATDSKDAFAFVRNEVGKIASTIVVEDVLDIFTSVKFGRH